MNASSLAPFRCEPFLRPMVWGGRRLGERLGKSLPTDAAYGEAWDVSDHAVHQSRIAVGPEQGQTLRHLWTTRKQDLAGAATGTAFPWLIKWLDCHDWLSVQVHPDDAAALRLWPGERGKTEAWFILEAEPGARIYAGLKPGMDELQLRAAAEAGTIADCLHSFTPMPGDCVYLPAGTVHAVGGGVLMAEVQQTSDATFRLFDWNRLDAQGKGRQLHLEQGLKAIHWDYGPVAPIAATGFNRAQPKAPLHQQGLCSCPYFQLAYWNSGQQFSLGDAGRLQAFIVVEGSGVLETATSAETVAPGQVWVIPAHGEAAICRPRPTVGGILCALPS